MLSREQVIEKIKALYKLAEGTNNEGEAAAAIASAEKLIQKYRIEQAEVGTTDKKEFYREIFYNGPKFSAWKRRLLQTLGYNYGCAIFTTKYNWQAVGRPDDMSLLRIQYDRIVDQIDRLTLRKCKGQGKTFADSYRKGVVLTVCTRLLESYNEVKQTSTAIVKLDNRQAEAKATLGETQSIQLYSGKVLSDAYEQGKKDGHQVHTGAYLDNGRATKFLNN